MRRFALFREGIKQDCRNPGCFFCEIYKNAAIRDASFVEDARIQQSGVLLYGKYIRLPQSSKMWLGERQDCRNLVSLHNGNTRDCCKVVTFYSAGKNFAAISNVFCRNVTKFSKKCLLSLRRLSVWSAKSELLI